MSLVYSNSDRPPLPSAVSEFESWVAEYYPDAVAVARLLRRVRGAEGVPWWPDWCYVPFLGVWQSIMCDGEKVHMGVDEAEQAVVLTMALSHLANPRVIEVPLDRVPQRFADLEEPPGMLRGLPGYAPAISMQDHDAVLVPWLDWDSKTTRATFMSMVLHPGKPPRPLPIVQLSGYETIREAIAEPLEAIKQTALESGDMSAEEVAEIDIDAAVGDSASALMLVRSICRPTPHARRPWDHGRSKPHRGGHRSSPGRRRQR